VAIMGFTGATGHVWKTMDAGTTWIDFTGDTVSLPDAPVNTLLVDSSTGTLYAGTDVGVFETSTSAPMWNEVGPAPGSGESGFLPNVAVTGLALFNSENRRLLRASTYGRGMWQADLNPIPDFQIAVSDADQTIFLGPTPTFHGTLSAIN